MSVLIAPLALGLGVAWLESRHRLRPASPLKLRALDWHVDPSGAEVRITGLLEISNPHPRMEVFVPELRVDPVLLGKSDPSALEVSTRIDADHPDEETREDGYWAAYIVKGRKTTRARVRIRLRAADGRNPLDLVDSLWVDVHWLNYGPFGRLPRRQGVLVPLRRPQPLSPDAAEFLTGDGCRVLPLRTHLLGPLDDPIDVMRTYAAALVRGDMLTIGGLSLIPTALAIQRGGTGDGGATALPGLPPHQQSCHRLRHADLDRCGGADHVVVAWIGGLLMKLIGFPVGSTDWLAISV